ncbi:MAG: septum formation protein Maf [Clostridia bacterium]|nr:septum formation protein Maf [Clostridia bacterium]
MNENVFSTEFADIPVVLASASPRRRELLSRMGISFSVLVSEADETLPAGTPPAEGALVVAERKARAVLPLCEGALVIAADTTVDLDGTPLGKPRDTAEAAAMLRALSGRTHRVHTGVCVAYRGRLLSAVDTTAVSVRALSDAEITAYVATGEPMDKAGAYGIQGLGGALVAATDGEMDTVVGLPCRLLSRLLCEVTS